jgi:putative NADH-flavin reductase
MKIILFGPTGGTGRALIEQALAARHEVTAFARNPGALEPRARLSVVQGNVLDRAAVENAIAGHDAVLCALGGRLSRGSSPCLAATGSIVTGMARHGVRRVVAMSTFGAGETRTQVEWLPRKLVFGFLLRHEVADKEAMERALSQTDLEWVVVRVGRLTDDPARGAWRAADDGSIRGMGKIARADVAAFMLAQLTGNQWLRRRPVIMY